MLTLRLLSIAAAILACIAAARGEDLPSKPGVPVVLASKLVGDVLWVVLDGEQDLIAIDRKHLKDASVYIAVPQKPGLVRVQAIGIDDGKPAFELFRVKVEGVTPVPPQPPTPPEPPTPPVPPVAKLTVLIVEESSRRSALPASQIAAMTSPEVRGWLNDKCGVNGWRLIDKDTDVSKASEWWQQAMAVPRTGLPWIVISSATQAYSGPLPATVAEVLALLKKYGG
jgi:hypothetical protein